uniref:Bis(5'-nucleosyl)-tetraphosphatase [asymmetrical] n=1 Tax=Clastoptera arizonana TaxID=38151 RepID=A0A1B6D6Q1_9HEMI
MVLAAAGFVIYRIISSEVQYLLMQTSYGINHWTPPKGHVDPGESDFDTAVRETREESGINLADLRIIEGFKKIIEYNVKGKNKRVTYWLAELLNPETAVIMSEEHQAYKWLPLQDACQLANFKEMQDVLIECQKFIDSR